MKTTTRWVLALAAMLTAWCAMAAEPGTFVSVDGMQFSWHGQPYRIVGTNVWYGGYLGSTGKVGNRARLAKELDTLQALGINNLRVLAVSEASTIAGAVKPATTNGFGNYDEELLAGLDYLLSALAKRNMTAVLYLNNFWQWSGGMSQYLSWIEGNAMLDPEVTFDYPAFMANSARFYQSAQANAEYRKTIALLVNRINTVTKRVYRDDPTIMAWQLANEPRPGNDKASTADKDVYVKWLDETAGYIHSLDHNHLVSSGSEGVKGSANDGPLFERAHQSPQLDYLTFHLWPRNWGWFNPRQPDVTWNQAVQKSLDYLQWHFEAAARLRKPIVLEEFGMDRDRGLYGLDARTTLRDKFYQAVFSMIHDNAKAGGAAAGSNFWAWNGTGRARDENYRWQTGDDLLGDPPQERQGLNGVFDADRSTLDVIKQHAEQMRALGNR